MNNENFIVSYVHACSSNHLPVADCGPVWQLGIIATLLVMAIISLAILSFRSGPAQA
jgi:hypothetical protein